MNFPEKTLILELRSQFGWNGNPKSICFFALNAKPQVPWKLLAFFGYPDGVLFLAPYPSKKYSFLSNWSFFLLSRILHKNSFFEMRWNENGSALCWRLQELDGIMKMNEQRHSKLIWGYYQYGVINDLTLEIKQVKVFNLHAGGGNQTDLEKKPHWNQSFLNI